MKKIIAIVTLMTLCLTASFKASAIEDPTPAGTKTIGVLAGIDPFYYSNVGVGGLFYFDYVLADNWGGGHFTVGGQFGYEYYTSFSHGAFSISPRVTYGLNITEKIEAHLGLAMGYYNFGRYLSGFHHSEFVGMYYHFTPSFSLSAQLGYTLFSPALCVGVAFQF